MRAKAIVDLEQLADTSLYSTVARGLRLILANALNLWRDGLSAGKGGHKQSASILRSLAEEEAAKFHILLDAIRCPRGPRFTQHLRHFYDHLARGIYAEHYNLYPTDFGDVKRIVGNLRVALYLDGPEGFEWIFRNRIIERREQQLYVDYVQSEDAHTWSRPERHFIFPLGFPARVLTTARSLARVGVATPCGLRVVANIWRPFTIEDATNWGELREKNIETLKSLEANRCLRSVSNETIQGIVRDWAFPLYALDLTEDRSVNLGDLRRMREEAEVSWMEREFGYPDY
jgi:AbiV family abortive infection protein